MRLRQVVGVALVSAAAVVVTDLLLHSSLLRALRPRILSPADGAIITGPVTVTWEGPEPMQATLTGSGQRIDLGLRQSPFEIDSARFPRPGQYGIELSATQLGGFVRVDRRFMVRRPIPRDASPTAETAQAGEAPQRAPAAPPDMSRILVERDQLRVELAALQSEVNALRSERAAAADALDAQQADSDARLDASERQRDALARDHALALQENHSLRLRLASVPPCIVWGYLSAPRTPTAPASRLVVVSNRRGEIFRSELQCVAARRGDPTGLSPCACVGAVPTG
ncbi:MAG: hypothetical protein AB7V27_12905 [Candidatus Binatia bacterium]